MSVANETIINVQELEPRLRHATIFKTFDGLKKGESLIIHNNHDPKPVYYQLVDMRGNVFSWEYLQQGPEWWDIRVTRTVPEHLSEGGTFVLNVPAIAPPSKHAAIFQVFDSRSPGESFIIHNDHDPKPLYHQLSETRGDTFEWEYLQEGPEWWNIRITVKPISKAGEQIIIVPQLEPRLKHPTIFGTFENLSPGESFIIRNDHDPKPVYYHLMDQHGDVFTWEYLTEGPYWWNIRVTRKAESATPSRDQNHAVGATEAPQFGSNEIVVDVPSLEPRLKHPTIFKTFDSLKAGESMIIHNDHDPKPVYYQLQSERGDVFTWEYLQEGPEWWDIRLTRKGSEIKETIGEIMAKDIRKANIFKKFGIDFCCGGKKTVRQACAELGIDPTPVEFALQQPVDDSVTKDALNYNDWNLDFLADFIVNKHHTYVKKYMPEIERYAAKVTQVHGSNHPELHEINALVQKVSKEMYEHMVEEENVLFPMIKEIVKAHNTGTKLISTMDKSFGQMIEGTIEEHESVGNDVDKIREISNNFELPSDACTSYKLLYKMLDEFEDDLHIHVHLENNILFPKAEKMENSVQ